MSALNPFIHYPHLYAAIEQFDNLLYDDEDPLSPEEVHEAPAYSPPKIKPSIYVKTPMVTSITPLAIDSAADLSNRDDLHPPRRNLIDLFLDCIFCCCRRARRVEPATIVVAQAPPTAPALASASDLSSVARGDLPLISSASHDRIDTRQIASIAAPLARRPTLDMTRISAIAHFNYPSPTALAQSDLNEEARRRAYTSPEDLEALNGAIFWRKNMVKDLILPSIPACDLIIHDKNYHELRLLKELFSKPEHRTKFFDLSPSSQAILRQVQTGSVSPILSVISVKAVATRTGRAHTDPTPAHLLRP